MLDLYNLEQSTYLVMSAPLLEHFQRFLELPPSAQIAYRDTDLGFASARVVEEIRGVLADLRCVEHNV